MYHIERRFFNLSSIRRIQALSSVDDNLDKQDGWARGAEEQAEAETGCTGRRGSSKASQARQEVG